MQISELFGDFFGYFFPLEQVLRVYLLFLLGDAYLACHIKSLSFAYFSKNWREISSDTQFLWKLHAKNLYKVLPSAATTGFPVFFFRKNDLTFFPGGTRRH